MKITTVLFDLDGTLLPMDQDEFANAYFGLLAKKLAPYGYDPKQLVAAIWTGTKEMVKNNGKQTNEAAFWGKFCEIFGQDAAKDEPIFADFYENEFSNVQAICGYHEDAAKVVHFVKEKGLRVALATNPIFPTIATRNRILWAGLAPEDFELYTTYENSCFCKPNLDYYRSILKKLGVEPDECLMVGNDVSEDMVAQKLGMQVFLLSDCLINKEDNDITVYPRGSFPELMEFIRNIKE